MKEIFYDILDSAGFEFRNSHIAESTSSIKGSMKMLEPGLPVDTQLFTIVLPLLPVPFGRKKRLLVDVRRR